MPFGGQLELSRRGLIQLFDKDFGIGAITTAKVPRQDDFGMSLNREERPSIALALRHSGCACSVLYKPRIPTARPLVRL
jgi:hypothetical protein